MKKFIKENLVLAIGLTLPLLLIVLFFVATVIPKSMATPPQYEMLFTTVHYDYQNASDYQFDFSVKDHQLMVKANKSDEKNRNYNAKKLMAYDGKTETVREISFDAAKAGAAAANGEIVLDETKTMQVDTASNSPDGYVLEGPNYGGGGLVGGMFGGGYRNSAYRLKKGGVAYKVPNAQQNYYYNQMQFVGWVVKK
ncbi:hypothetical protein GALL_204270 [mine drainage metagenome]|uniref:Uncharacterized protein n=1 Tax=mine drainage metagenome TaxID=410659 RepID=A0A1J5S055_9ZZZZ